MSLASDTQSQQTTGNEDVLLVERDGPIVILTLNRPKARNSLSEALLLALRDALTDLGNDKDAYAAILRAEGTVFSAGHDLKELTARRTDDDGGRAYFEKILTLCSDVMQLVMRCPKPVIAAVEGTATAAGCQLVASCDLAVASEDAHFCTPGVNIGLFCSTPMVALSRNVARKQAMEMLLLGDMIGADDALAFGLVNRVVAADQVMVAARGFADKIAVKAPKVVRVGKMAFYEQMEMGVADAYAYASSVMVDNMMMRDCEEGVGAFIEKRPAKWDDL